MKQPETGNDGPTEDQHEMELLEPTNKQHHDDTSKTVVEPPDGGYGWVVVIAGALNLLITVGQIRASAFIYAKLIDIFQNATVEIGALASVWLALQTLSGPVAGALSQKYGLRKIGMIGGTLSSIGMVLGSFPVALPYLFITLSLLGGVGDNFVVMSSMVAPAGYFKRKRALAIALVTLGISIGIIIYPIITVRSLNAYGYTGTMLILAAITLNRIPLCFLYRSLQTRHNKTNNRNKLNCLRKRKRTGQDAKHCDIAENPDEPSHIVFDNTKAENEACEYEIVQKPKPLHARLNSKFEAAGLGILRNGIFLSICFFSCTFSFLISIMTAFITKFATDLNVSQIQISIVLTLSGVSDAIGKVLSGFLFDWKYIRSCRVVVFCLTGTLMGVFVIFMAAFARGIVSLAVLYLLIVVLWGTLLAQLVTIVFDVVGREAAKGFGITIFTTGVGFFLGPLIGGTVSEAMGAFWGAFLVGGCVLTVGSLVLTTGYIVRRNKDIKREENPAAGTEVDCA